MASAVSSLSYLDPAAYQNLILPSATTSTTSTNGVSATVELQALEQQGDFLNFLNNSVAEALLQPADSTDTGAASSTLINNMLQQVLGAYQAQSSSTSGTG
jgi:hypothetical protein